MNNEEIIAESGWRETDLRRTYNKKQIFEMLDKARASGLPSKSRDEANAYVRGKEAGQQFALAEIDELNRTVEFLNKLLIEKQEQTDKYKQQLSDANAKIKKYEEGIGKLKEELKDILYCGVPKISYLNEKIDEIFPSSAEDVRGNSAEFPKSSCAEQPKLNLKMTDKEVKEAKKGYKEFFGEEPKTEQPVCKNCGETRNNHEEFDGVYRCIHTDRRGKWCTVFEPKTEPKLNMKMTDEEVEEAKKGYKKFFSAKPKTESKKVNENV